MLQKYGLGGGLAGGVGLSALAAAGVVVTVLLIDKVGRRVLTAPTQWLCTVLLAVIGLWAGAPPMVVLVLFLAFSFFNAGYNTLACVYPGRGVPDRGPRDRDGLRGRCQPDRGRPRHVPAAVVHDEPRRVSVHADRRRHRRCRCRTVAVAGSRDKGMSLTETAAVYAH